MSAIDWHLAADRNQHDSVRKKSIRQQKSIIIAIFETKNPQLLESLTDRQHTACLDYYAAQLAIRDREQIVGVMCRSSPDLTTAIVLEVLGALDPMIRVVHKNVDLRKHLSAIESFLTDFIKTTKPKMRDNSSELRLIAVKDFVELLHRNRHLLYTYLHDFCSGCPDLRDTWRDWMKNAIKAFRQKSKDPGMGAIPVATELGVTNLSDTEQGLQDAFNKLPNQRQAIVLERVNAHSKYLMALQKLSREKMQQIIDEMHGKGHSDVEKISGPGIYAARWQALLDETLITPFIPRGPLRSGKDIKHLRAARRPDAQSAPNTAEMSAAILAQDEPTGPVPPDVSAVTEALGPQFKRIVAYMSRDGLPGDKS
ncbi:putative px domain-containing protein [Rosellinia necatrix]|uniref:Putative px domain-containing protein n=1 Tax=Rosellinia necatrix TaxID=77044 RepID=A0A1S8A8E1_ROSNE|nr:putative px domain-containing protein [Rosellinia necatrix]